MEIMIGFTEEQLKEIMNYQERIKAETVQDAVMIAVTGNATTK